ncbi:MAG: type II secretion system protein [Fimbriimonadaceae bacterium]|nr:type II secretion system protein [Fimbriimonadaceae bacterium]
MQKRTGWSLVELLVVMAIFALLAGLLFPVMHSAEKSAKSAACLNNLSQIARATSLYVADYDDWYPASLDAWDKARTTVGERYPNVPAFQDAVEPYLGHRLAFRCPDDHGTVDQDGRPVATPTMFEAVGSSYTSHSLPRGFPLSSALHWNSTLVWQATGQVHREAPTYSHVLYYQVHADWHVSVSKTVRLR